MQKKRIRIGKYKTVFKGKILEVQRAEVIYSNGRKTTFERAIRPASVSVLAIDGQKRILLTREYRHKHNGYLWNLPGGRTDKGETPKAAAQRELREEAGIQAKRLTLFHFNDMSQTLEWKRYMFLATGLSPAPLNADEDEDITIVPMTLNKAMTLIRAGKIENETIAYVVSKLYYNRKKFGI